MQSLSGRIFRNIIIIFFAFRISPKISLFVEEMLNKIFIIKVFMK